MHNYLLSVSPSGTILILQIQSLPHTFYPSLFLYPSTHSSLTLPLTPHSPFHSLLPHPFAHSSQFSETCSISPGGDSTVLNKTVTGNLAQDEAVEVSCKNTDWLLPYGTPTPWIIVCTDKQDFSIPVCQRTFIFVLSIINYQYSVLRTTKYYQFCYFKWLKITFHTMNFSNL